MFTFHVISDLFLGSNEPAPEIELNIPDVDLVILNGNIGDNKRSLIHAYALSNKYPTTQFIHNQGFTEKHIGSLLKHTYEFDNSKKLRSYFGNNSQPSNLHCDCEGQIIELRNGCKIDVMTKFGYPKIYQHAGNWKDTYWYKNMIGEVTYDMNHPKWTKPKDTSNVDHGHIYIWAEKEHINERHEKELIEVRNWELTPTVYKVLVTHINPVNDSRMNNIIYTSYDIHLDKGLWVGASSKTSRYNYVGASLIANPGRGIEARSFVATW